VRRVLAPAIALAVAGLTAGVASAGTAPVKPPPREIAQFGYVRSLAPTGNVYELRFDPALFLTGETARRAALQDGVIGPGEPVPNDYYIVNADRRALVYRVLRNAPVTVITSKPFGSTRITVAELAALLHGRNPGHRKLFDPGRHLGYWIRVQSDTVRSLDQQYQP
jgi:hypothetical protein